MESVEYLGFLIEVVSPESGTYEYSVFDMTGKDKPEFPVFETDDVGFVSFDGALDDAKSWVRDFLFNDEGCAKEHIEKLYATKKALSGSQSLEATGHTVQKLTTDVFDRLDCLNWARYAAVNPNGKVVLFSDEPSCHSGDDRWVATYSSRVYILDDELFDASDWRNSLIERRVFQKITAGVFDRQDCPDWANYAAVNRLGTLIFFGNEPCFEGEDYGCWSYSGYECLYIKDEVFDATDWPNSLIKRPAPQKLTADVFNRPDCPDWANYAAVDSNNKAYWFKGKPEKAETGCWWSPYGDFDRIPGKFDATDWQNSLIERPEKKETLPDWCKVGEWVYYFDEVDGYSYQKIDKIDDKYIYFYRKFDRSKPSDPLVSDRVVYSVFIENTKQARLRPYNADEMRTLLGKVVGNEHGNMFLVTAFVAVDGGEVCVDGVVYNADDLLECYTIDGSPCGKLVHKEGDEWVE